MTNLTFDLIRRVIEKDSEIERNRILTHLRNHIKTGKNPTITEIVGFSSSDIPQTDSAQEVSADSQATAPESISSQKTKELLTAFLALREIRRFEGRDDNAFYGLKLSIDDKPASCIFIGQNGIGKSTFFNALELAMAGKILSMDGIINDVDSYLKCLTSKKTGDIALACQDPGNGSNTIFFGRNNHAHTLPCFICSEKDIRTIQALGDDISNYVYHQLGISATTEALNNLRNAIEAVEAAKERFNLIKQMKATNLTKSDLDEELDLNFKTKQIIKVSDIFTTEDNPNSKDIWLNQAKQLHQRLKEEFDSWIKENFDKYIDKVFSSLFKKFQDGHHKFEIKLSNGSIKAGVWVDGENTPHSYYLNSFRSMMFCFALKIALACCASNIYGIHHPIIVDDIFYSGDFDNRVKLESFIKSLIDIYHDHCSHSLQLIFFTQDNLIGDSIFKALASNKMTQPVKFSRIFDYTAIMDDEEEYDSINFKYNNQDSKVIILEDPINSVSPLTKQKNG